MCRQFDLERGARKPVQGFEAERERKGAARSRRVGQAHADRPAVFDDFRAERRGARKTVRIHRPAHALGIAPVTLAAIDKMPADEGKQQRIAATYAGRLAPVGRHRPIQDRRAGHAPAQQAATELRRQFQPADTLFQLQHGLLVARNNRHGGFHCDKQ
jgi:hypothetical protein